MPVREKMQQQPPEIYQYSTTIQQSGRWVLYRNEQDWWPLPPTPAHMPTAQPVCEAGEWYWQGDEGGTE